MALLTRILILDQLRIVRAGGSWRGCLGNIRGSPLGQPSHLSHTGLA